MENKDLNNIKNGVYNTFMELYMHLDATGKAIVENVINDIKKDNNDYEIEIRKFLEKHVGIDYKSKFINECLGLILDDIISNNKELFIYKIVGFNPSNNTIYIKVKDTSRNIEVSTKSIKGSSSLSIYNWYIGVKDDETNIIEITTIKAKE